MTNLVVVLFLFCLIEKQIHHLNPLHLDNCIKQISDSYTGKEQMSDTCGRGRIQYSKLCITRTAGDRKKCSELYGIPGYLDDVFLNEEV